MSVGIKPFRLASLLLILSCVVCSSPFAADDNPCNPTGASSFFKTGYEWISRLPKAPLEREPSEEAIRCGIEYTNPSGGNETRHYFSYLKLNRLLRHPNPIEGAIYQATLLEEARLGQPIYVGETDGMTVRREEGTERQYKVGSVVTNMAFTSCSANPNFGCDRYGNPKNCGNVSIVIVPPENSQGTGREFWRLSVYPREREVLFGPGARFKVVHCEKYSRSRWSTGFTTGLSARFSAMMPSLGRAANYFVTLQELDPVLDEPLAEVE